MFENFFYCEITNTSDLFMLDLTWAIVLWPNDLDDEEAGRVYVETEYAYNAF